MKLPYSSDYYYWQYFKTTHSGTAHGNKAVSIKYNDMDGDNTVTISITNANNITTTSDPIPIDILVNVLKQAGYIVYD